MITSFSSQSKINKQKKNLSQIQLILQIKFTQAEI